jgi:hypothetical protein
MDFNGLISKIMPEVNGGSHEPIMIYRDKNGDWHGGNTQNQYGETYAWVEDVREQDPLALTVTGADYSKGSFGFVYDKIFLERLRLEYDLFHNDGTNVGEPYAIINFMEDNISGFSRDVTDYLMELERPFAALNEMIPQHLKRDISGSFLDEETQDKFIDHVETQVEERLKNRSNKATVSRESEKLNIEGYEERTTIQLAGRAVVLAENPVADKPYMVCKCRWDNPISFNEYYDVMVTADYLNAVKLFVNYQSELLEQLTDERQRFGLPFQTLTSANCIPNSMNESLEDKLIIIKPEALTPEYRSAEYQLKICTGGFGASPNSRGNAVFCKDFYSGKQSRFERWDVAGVADIQTLPAWVDKKIALKEALKEPGVFEYGGYHFKPLRKFRKGEIDKPLANDSRPWKQDARYAMRNMQSDSELALRNDGTAKTVWSHEAFYTASGNSKCDVFRCIENGKLYVPCENQLFRYDEPPQKEKKGTPQTEELPIIDTENIEKTTDNDKFYLDENGRIEQLYYNPDGFDGKGQYVSNIFYHHDVLDFAIEAAGSTEIFFNAIAEDAKQYLYDNDGTDTFKEAEAQFYGDTHDFMGCTESTQNGLIEFAREHQKVVSAISGNKKPSLSARIEKGKEKVREADKTKEKSDKPKKLNKGVDD